jgi:hypothetical protein
MGEGSEKVVWGSGVPKVDLDTLRRWLFLHCCGAGGQPQREVFLWTHASGNG